MPEPSGSDLSTATGPALPDVVTAAFPLDAPPFDALDAAERAVLLASLDLGVYGAGDVLLQRDEVADSLFVVLQGLVHERLGGETVAVLRPGECFDLRALFAGDHPHSYQAAGDTLCALVPRTTVVALANANPAFADVVHHDFAARLRAVADERSNREMAALTVARIRQAYLRPPVFVDAGATLREAAVAMRDREASAVLVRDGARTGILTGTDLRDLVVIDGLATSAAVGPHARYDLLARDADDLLFDALILMTKHSVRRIVVTERGAILGMLEQIDLLGALTNHSQAVALTAERASSPEELARASRDTVGLIRTLHTTGVRMPFIAELVTELNRKIFRRLFELLAPPDLLANSCLIVMGSEGRGEQLLKTDQDNGLILRDGYACPGLDDILAAFTGHLADFGYPPCPGGIMVSNPDWARPLAGYKEGIFRWIHRPDETAPLNLAIFYDACAVAGDATLLDAARGYLLERVQANQGFFYQFARPVLAFDTPTSRFGGLFDWRGTQSVDIKKAGVFPLVHGVRALALEKRLDETNTIDRIWALADRNVLDRPFAGELVEAFVELSTLRLQARIDTERATAAVVDNLVHPAEMSKLDRDRFNDCLAVVKSFKQFVSHHFHLNLH